jgi:hypothetical protein
MFERVFHDTFVAHERVILGYFNFWLAQIGIVLSPHLVLLILTCFHILMERHF